MMELVQPDKKGVGGARASTTLTDMKLKIAEHLIDQTNKYGPDELYSIMAEAKVRTSRRTDLVDRVRLVFSIS